MTYLYTNEIVKMGRIFIIVNVILTAIVAQLLYQNRFLTFIAVIISPILTVLLAPITAHQICKILKKEN